MAASVPRSFDCGRPDRPAASGFVALSGQDSYTSGRGYGWLKPWGSDWDGGLAVKSSVRGSLTDARAHLEGRPEENDVTFRIDLPNGVYRVTVWPGIESPTEGRLGISLAANGRVVIPPPGVGGWGIVAERTVPAVVSDEHLLLNFYVTGQGGAARLSLLGFKIEDAANTAEREQLARLWENSGSRDEEVKSIEHGGRSYVEVGRKRQPSFGQLPPDWREQPLMIFTRSDPGDLVDYSVPRLRDRCDSLSAFAAPGEDQSFWFAVHRPQNKEDMRVEVACSILTDPTGRCIDSAPAEWFTLRTRPRSLSDRRSNIFKWTADLLVPASSAQVSSGSSQAFYLRLPVPADAAPGVYAGHVTLTATDQPAVSLPLILRILPLTLQKPPQHWHIFSDPYRWPVMPRKERHAEIEDMARHGINSLSIAYPPFGAAYIEKNGHISGSSYGVVEEVLQHARAAGMSGPVQIAQTPGVLRTFRGWNRHHSGNATYSFETGSEGRALVLQHDDNNARSSLHQAIGALLSPDSPATATIRYRTEGEGRGVFKLIFMTNYKRGEVETGRIIATLPPAAEWQTFSADTTVPDQAPYARASFEFIGGKGKLIVDHVSLTTDKDQNNMIINPGFERDFERPPETADFWSEEFVEEYVSAMRALGDAVRRNGFEPWIQGTDEAKGSYRELAEMMAARRSGLKTFCNLSPSAVDLMGDTLDVVCFYSSFLGTEKDCSDLLQRLHNRGQKLYIIASGAYVGQEFDLMPNRHHVGLAFWKSGADGNAIWTYQRPNGDPFDDLDEEYKDYCLVFPPETPGGKPLPTLGWEGIREGWRDFLYVRTLQQTVAMLRERGDLANLRFGEEVLSFIRETIPWFDAGEGLGYDNAAADRLRWLAAWAVMMLQQSGDPDVVTVSPGVSIPMSIVFEDADSRVPAPLPQGIPAIKGTLHNDGKLDEELWSSALCLNNLVRNADGTKAEVATEFLLCHDFENLYIGVRCFEPAIDELVTAAVQHDDNVFADDSIELFLDTSNNETDYLQLAFNAAGVRFDQRCRRDEVARGNVFGADYAGTSPLDPDWNGEWQVITSRHEDRWEAEVVLPFRTIGRESDLWGVNFCRNRKAGAVETSTWQPLRFFHHPESFGKVFLMGARSGSGELVHFAPAPLCSGLPTSQFTLRNLPGLFSASTETTWNDATTRSTRHTSDNGTFLELPFSLSAAVSRVDYRLFCGESLTHLLKMPVSVPAALQLVSGSKILYNKGAKEQYSFKLNVAGTMPEPLVELQLRDPAGSVAANDKAFANGTDCTVVLDLTGRATGLYTLSFKIYFDLNSKPIEHLERIVLAPSFIN